MNAAEPARAVNGVSRTRPHLSVVIPTHNEVGTVAEVVRDIYMNVANVPTVAEVLVIDDGSTDGTAEAAESAGARVIRLPVNGGKGRAMRRGINEAVGDILVFLDGDGQDDPTDLPTLLEALTPDVDMVIGSRFLGRFEDGSITTLNRLGTRILTATLNRLFGASVSDPIAGYRVVRKGALSGCRLTAQRYDIEVDILLALLEKGRRVVEIPVARYPRSYGRTDLSSFRDGSLILWRILSRRVGFG
jgi:glycosyltransferase involved in cell wall biosynthesis